MHAFHLLFNETLSDASRVKLKSSSSSSFLINKIKRF